jgi:DNA-binding CsgD family transcriptional regulator
MDLTRLFHAVGTLSEARGGAGVLLLDPGVMHGLGRVFSADKISFADPDLRAEHSSAAPPLAIGVDAEADNNMFWDPLTSCDANCFGTPPPTVLNTGLVMPLPGPPGIGRRLVFCRRSDYPFLEEESAAAALLQPHIADAIRVQSHRAAAQLLTRRQHELLRLVATGYDNVAIARQLCLSPTTVRTHLENAFDRLDVSSRTAAVARLWPDITWH